MTTVEAYRMVEPQTMTDAELRDLFGYRRQPNVLGIALKFSLWCCLFYAVIIAALIIW
jgi:hypothetical protein